jgi:hypothetical protein
VGKRRPKVERRLDAQVYYSPGRHDFWRWKVGILGVWAPEVGPPARVRKRSGYRPSKERFERHARREFLKTLRAFDDCLRDISYDCDRMWKELAERIRGRFDRDPPAKAG